jgi:hypothetical protein
LGIVLAGLLFGALHAGGLAMQSIAQTPLTLTTVLQALIVLFVAAPALVTKIVPFLKPRKTGRLVRFLREDWRERRYRGADGTACRGGIGSKRPRKRRQRISHRGAHRGRRGPPPDRPGIHNRQRPICSIRRVR